MTLGVFLKYNCLSQSSSYSSFNFYNSFQLLLFVTRSVKALVMLILFGSWDLTKLLITFSFLTPTTQLHAHRQQLITWTVRWANQGPQRHRTPGGWWARRHLYPRNTQEGFGIDWEVPRYTTMQIQGWLSSHVLYCETEWPFTTVKECPTERRSRKQLTCHVINIKFDLNISTKNAVMVFPL